MFVLSAFADEISPDPVEQIRVLKNCGVQHIEFRSIYGTNVLNLTDTQVKAFRVLLREEGMKLSAIGSPIGKIRIDEPFEPHIEKFKRAIELASFFKTPNIRIFSFYPPENFAGDWSPYRGKILDRLGELIAIAAEDQIQLFHENEHRIYGDSPERVRDLFHSIQSQYFKAAYDPANFVFSGFSPIEGWEASKAHLGHLHIKDWKTGEAHGSLAGEGDGQMETVLREANQMGYQGFATLEPHLLGGGPTGGQTGPELFPKAVDSLKLILQRIGADFQ